MNVKFSLTINDNGRRSRYTGQVMTSAGLDCCSKSASTTCPNLSGNVYKDFKFFNEHTNPAFAIAFVMASVYFP